MSENKPLGMGESGAYEVLKNRLSQQGQQLKTLALDFNQHRQNLFGGQDIKLIGKVNVQTEARCIPIDMGQVNDQLLFGYQVRVGLKAIPALHDVFGLYQLHENEGVFRLEPTSIEESFLADDRFVHEFTELFTYYSDAKLQQIARQESILYIAFQIGMRPEDRKVFRFQIGRDSVSYLDALGHTTLEKVAQFDFEWIATSREDHVLGTHPHVSIQDKLFVECVGGDLTIKIEDNTNDGKGIYREPVDDLHQSVADASIDYVFIGELIALRIKPHREKNSRYFIYNPINQTVVRSDALGKAGKVLPEEHGVLLSHGYVLANGESKFFDIPWTDLEFFYKIASPNGEDVIYYFFNKATGAYVSFSYNLIEKRFSSPLDSHGFSLSADGQMLVFQAAENPEASTLHPLQIWQTPYSTPEYYANLTAQAQGTSPLFNLGNAELVRALSSVLSICQLAQNHEATQAAYEWLLKQCNSALDHYHWLQHDYALGIGSAIQNVVDTADHIIDEFAKVQQLKLNAQQSLASQRTAVAELIGKIKLAPKEQANVLIEFLAKVKSSLGRVMALNQQHYMDSEGVETLLDTLSQQRHGLNQQLLTLLQDPKAYQPYKTEIEQIELSLSDTEKTSELNELQKDIEALRAKLQLVTEEVTDIETDDPTQSTRILDLTTEVSSLLNALSAKVRGKSRSLRTEEAQAEFSAQFKLLSQAVNTAMEQATTPDECDNQLARLIGQLDKLESRFADFDQFLAEIYTKRDEIQSTLDNHKQQLMAGQQRRIQNLQQAAQVTLSSIEKRVSRFEDVGELNSYFATDALVVKLQQLSASIRELGDSVKADALDSKLKALQDQSLRAMRDNQDIFEQGGKVLKLGRHRFSVNQQALDLSLIEYHHQLCTHISGTDFYQPIVDEQFLQLQDSAKLEVTSESEHLYRGEYLAYLLLHAAQQGDEYSLSQLEAAREDNRLLSLIQRFSAPRYREGYVKGIHDHDAHLILSQILPIYQQAGLLRFGQMARANALIWCWRQASLEDWQLQANNALLLKNHLHSNAAYEELQQRLMESLPVAYARESSDYLIQILAQPVLNITVSREAFELCEDYLQYRRSLGWSNQAMDLDMCLADHMQWLAPYSQSQQRGEAFVVEAAMIAVCQTQVHSALHPVDFSLAAKISGLLGEHPRLTQGNLQIVLDDYLQRCEHHRLEVVPRFDAYLEKRTELLNQAKQQFRLQEFKPRPLTSFVRNKLISDSYLPLIGDNFAKQMGTLGDKKRTDLMGMLLLISPPGYGKTTLIEYVAAKLGLVFMKVNGPAIGHGVTSLDPSEAPDKNAVREIEKINLAFEMGNNVLLYLDDIQHTNPELLQKFISLCDGTRRIEGTWQGQTKTYDMRGKKFAVVMAGNPYTESGEAFRIPDMLANRADIYNLGDMLSDQQTSFALSFIENALTSNTVLAPLATRDLQDLYRFVRLAQGENIALSDMTHSYSATEADEIVSTLKKLMRIQDTILKVNQQYIQSAATADAYRVEPPFKLQGSYRNMNKLAEKVSAVMTEQELNVLIQDHYQGEAQTLAAGTEENLLKLAQLRGDMTDEQRARWHEITQSYQRQRLMGDSEDRAGQVVQQLALLNQSIAGFSSRSNAKESL